MTDAGELSLLQRVRRQADQCTRMASPLTGALLHGAARRGRRGPARRPAGRPQRARPIAAARRSPAAYQVDDDTLLGDPASPVRLVRPWSGPAPSAVPLTVVERAGCDPAPLDPSTTEGRLTLTSYVWGDQVHRLERLRGAFEVAAREPVVVERAGAADFLRRRLADPLPAVLTVVWHSVVRQYLSADERAAMDHVLSEAGERATAQAPLVRVGMEPEHVGDGDLDFRVRTTTWPGGHGALLADCEGHGPPVTWR